MGEPAEIVDCDDETLPGHVQWSSARMYLHRRQLGRMCLQSRMRYVHPMSPGTVPRGQDLCGPKFNGEPCSSDEECSGGVCNGADCAVCSSDEDCDDGNSCTVNACGDDGVCAPVVALEDGTSCGTATFGNAVRRVSGGCQLPGWK